MAVVYEREKPNDFAEADLRRPQQYWFYRDPGEAVHVLFLTKPCQWDRCRICALPTMSSPKVRYWHLIQQIDYFCENVLKLQGALGFESITIGNNGSILDPDTFPPSALFYLLARSRISCSTVRRFSFITRPEYATDSILGSLMEEALTYGRGRPKGGERKVAKDATDGFASEPATEEPEEAERSDLDLELTVGLETLSREAQKFIGKGFGNGELKGLTMSLGKWNDYSRSEAERASAPAFSLRAYYLLKPYPLEGDEAIRDVLDGIAFLGALEKETGIRTTMHLNPVYVAKHTELVKVWKEKRYRPPSLELIGETLLAIRELAQKSDAPVPRLCLGLSDEGMAEPEGSFVPSGAEAEGDLWRALLRFNEDRDEGKLKAFEAVASAMEKKA